MAFCPNCGTQQPDGIAACTKCKTPLTGGAAPSTKFKGTIMMGGASASDVEAMVQKAKAAVGARTSQEPAKSPTGSAPAAAAPSPAAPPSGGDDALAYQATIMGPITSPQGAKPAEFPHPLFGGAAEPAAAPDDDDEVHSAPTTAMEQASEGGPTIVDGSAEQDAALAFSDQPVSVPTKSGKGGMIVLFLIIGIVILVAVSAGAFLFFRSRTPDVPQYPGYPVPGQVMPGQVPGQFPGQFPGQVPGQFPGYPVPGQVPGMPVPGQAPAPPAQ